MSDRLERSTQEPAREVTPEATRPELFAFLEDKWKGREEGPRSLRLHLAFGAGGSVWRPAIVHEKEFKKNADPPTRPELVELANVFYGEARRHCDEVGKQQGYVVVAMSPVKGADPYGVHYMRLIPTPGIALFGRDGNPGEITSDPEHRDQLMTAQLEHTKETNENGRFMVDLNHRHTSTLLALYHELLREERARNAAHQAGEIERIKAIEELHAKRHEREMEKEKQQMIMGLAHGGINLLTQMVPALNKALVARSGAPAALEEGAIVPSRASIAIVKFIQELSNEQKLAIFGYRDDAAGGAHVPGILTSEQTFILSAVGDCKSRVSALDVLLPSGPHELQAAQIVKMSQVVPLARLMALQSDLMDRQPPAAGEAQPETMQ